MTPRDNAVTGGATTTPSGPRSADTHEGGEVRGMLRVLEQLGYDLDALLASAGLERGDVADPDALLPARACATVFENAHRERRVCNLALQLAQHTPVGANPLLDYLIVSSDSVGQGLERLTRYLRLVNPSVGLTVRREPTAVRVVVERAQTPFFTELTVSLCMIRFIRETDDQFRAAHVSFMHEPDDVVEYAQVLHCEIRAKGSWNGVVMPKSALELPLRRRDPALRGWLERQAAAILARLPASGDACDEVRSVLSAQATAGEMTIDAVARRLSTTPRTLQRRLARGGASFETLRDDARRRAAELYLSTTTLTIAEVTYCWATRSPPRFIVPSNAGTVRRRKHSVRTPRRLRESDGIKHPDSRQSFRYGPNALSRTGSWRVRSAYCRAGSSQDAHGCAIMRT